MFDRRLVLLATPSQIGVLDWRPGRMHWLGSFAATADGLTAFRAVVARHTRQAALLVVDTVDEDYRSETLPHVQGRAREELVARRLRQVFRNARYTGAWRQTRETTGRRDDSYLFSALTDAGWLAPWLAVLDAERAPLAGIVPLALACQPLLRALRIQEAHVLLAYRLNQRLRLSYYHDGRLRFSRLTGGDAPAPGNAADEIAKTQLYLTGQRMLPREARLHVVLVDAGSLLAEARAPLNADPAFSTRLVELSDLAAALRIPDDFLAAAPEIAPLAASAGEAMTLNLAPPELLRQHVEFRWRRGLYATAGAIALAGVAATGAWWLHAQTLHDQTWQLASTQRQVADTMRRIALDFPRDVAAPGQLAQTVALARSLEQPASDPADLLELVGQSLLATPNIALEALSWRDDSLEPGGGLVLRIDAAIPSFDGNYRAAMRHIERFIETLRASPRVREASLKSSPINADSTAALSGSLGAGRQAAAPFSVELRYREATP